MVLGAEGVEDLAFRVFLLNIDRHFDSTLIHIHFKKLVVVVERSAVFGCVLDGLLYFPNTLLVVVRCEQQSVTLFWF